MRRALGVAVAALALAAPAAAQMGVPFHPSGSVVGEGLPLKAYANIKPTVHLFGDTVRAQLAVVADTRWVDPTRLHVLAGFKPYEAVAPPVLLRLHVGRFEQLTWTWTLRCLQAPCVPVPPPSELYHVFRFHNAKVEYLSRKGTVEYSVSAAWPPVEVLSGVSPAMAKALTTLKRYDWQYGLAPVTAPTFQISPALLFWLALAGAGIALLAGVATAGRWYGALRRQATAGRRGTALERALELLAWAHARGDETLQRKAFERVGAELEHAGVDLSQAAHELAWSPRMPQAEEIEEFSERARGRSEDE
jgi:hypothetical protein